jgi:hypothetical protein
MFNRLSSIRVRFNRVGPFTGPLCKLHEVHQGVTILYKECFETGKWGEEH